MGTPAVDKRHAVLDAGSRARDIRGLIREVLDWLDKYLGPVKWFLCRDRLLAVTCECYAIIKSNYGQVGR